MPTSPHGHWWTIAPDLLGRLRPPTLEASPWSTTIASPEGGVGPGGPVRLAGALGDPRAGVGAGDKDLYLIVHGLGGDAERPYMKACAAAVAAHGHAHLRISMRGAGDSSPDFYHAGLASDLEVALADPSVAAYARVFVIGFSLGGHVALHLALRPARVPRLAAIIAVCSPLDLRGNVEFLDGFNTWIYRRHVLDGLGTIHEKIHGRRRRFRTIREWDAATIVPRYGFDDVEHYWASQCVGPRLREATLPILYIGTARDPMVPAKTTRPHLRKAGAAVDVRWLRRGGHVGFPANTDLGLPGELGLFNQILTWCEAL